jgi:2-oxoglutarate dehydrogenase E2 component (dihydrolipoamide succinyltransferase)
LLAWIGQPGEKIPENSFTPTSEITPDITSSRFSQEQADINKNTTSRDRDLGFISPVVSRIASEHHIDLFQVKGTGQGGRITKQDVMAFIQNYQTSQELNPITTPPDSFPGVIVPQDQSAPIVSKPEIPPSGITQAGDLLPLTAIRKSIADHMVLSKHTSPHVSTIMEADLLKVVAHRAENKDLFARDGVNLTYTAYFVAACVAALKAFPIVNSSWTDQGILIHRQINIGLATSLGKDGLIVPIIKNADSYSLIGLARAINDLARRARTKKLHPDEVKGGTITITNHGVSGSLFATPIINQPQSAILGIGAIQKRVVVISDDKLGDTIAIRPMVYISLTFDHRILDGAIADSFLSKVVESLHAW